MNVERWRCFVAVPIGEDLRRDLATSVEQWRDRADLVDLRWTDPDGWHVTLAFLGSVDAVGIPSLSERLAAVAASHPPVRLATGGLGAFPSRANGRVVWYGVRDVERDLADMAHEVTSALEVDTDARFRAHLTLARARSEPLDLRDFLVAESAPEGELMVDRVDLMRSHLGREPARYETVVSAPLGEDAEHG